MCHRILPTDVVRGVLAFAGFGFAFMLVGWAQDRIGKNRYGTVDPDRALSTCLVRPVRGQ